MAIIETHSIMAKASVFTNYLHSLASVQRTKIQNLLGGNIWMVPDDMVKQLGILLALQGTALDY